MTKETKQDFTLRITQANSTELIVILYDMILCYIQEGEEAYEANDRAAFREAIRKIRGCINELLYSLNMEYEIASNLLQLYLFCIRRLALAELRNKVELLGEIERIISKLRIAYNEIADQNNETAIMQNSQTVYAGLTYGRKTLTENMPEEGANRGFLI